MTTKADIQIAVSNEQNYNHTVCATVESVGTQFAQRKLALVMLIAECGS